jgi:hypothetical protein
MGDWHVDAYTHERPVALSRRRSVPTSSPWWAEDDLAVGVGGLGETLRRDLDSAWSWHCLVSTGLAEYPSMPPGCGDHLRYEACRFPRSLSGVIRDVPAVGVKVCAAGLVSDQVSALGLRTDDTDVVPINSAGRVPPLATPGERLWAAGRTPPVVVFARGGTATGAEGPWCSPRCACRTCRRPTPPGPGAVRGRRRSWASPCPR